MPDGAMSVDGFRQLEPQNSVETGQGGMAIRQEGVRLVALQIVKAWWRCRAAVCFRKRLCQKMKQRRVGTAGYGREPCP